MSHHILITGGAGFIGVNSACYCAERGWRITVLDNLSRRCTGDNLQWLRQQADIGFEHCDLRDGKALNTAIATARPDVLLHLATQVAVATSVTDPREDFEINALGTFNMLEAVRQHSSEIFVINASTNKVYGKQIRDVLHVDDLALAYQTAIDHREQARGEAFNIGGGPNNTLSLRELLAHLDQRLEISIPLQWADWQPGDQPVFGCNLDKAAQRLDWQPRNDVASGVGQLIDWVRDHRHLFDSFA